MARSAAVSGGRPGIGVYMAAHSPRLAPSGAQHAITHGDHHAVVVEVGGALRAYRLHDWDVLDGYAVDEMCTGARGQTLIPWPNRLRDGRYRFNAADHQLPLSEPERSNAIHGLVRWTNWTVGDRDVDRIRMEHVLHPQAGYPFTLQLAVHYTLAHDGLTVTTIARNAGAEPCPYGAGAHPYVKTGGRLIDRAILTAPGATWLPTDNRAIPVGRAPVDGTPYDFRAPRPIGDTELDTAFTDLQRDTDGWAHVRLDAADGRRRVDVAMDGAYGYVELYTGDALPEHDRRRCGLGIEPMTCAPNALASGDGLVVLQPGESHRGRWRITPERARE
jgi:aldose 1-epimerase